MQPSAVSVALFSFAALALAYVVYGRWLARRVFQLDDSRVTPAHALRDGIDYVPTKPPVLFGHHFASIAGLGPILGPAVAVIWGWVPAVLWVLLGCIFVGAVHDLGALTVSLRFRGRSIGDTCRELVGPRARLLFLVVVFFLMSLAMGSFVNAISELFTSFNPDAIIPSFGLMVVALVMGVAVYRYGVRLGAATIAGLAAFAALIYLGERQPVTSYDWFVSASTREVVEEARRPSGANDSAPLDRPWGAAAAAAYLHDSGQEAAVQDLQQGVARAKYAWIGALLAYAFVASVLPVWLLLQPRDYLNSFQLYFALGVLLAGLMIAGWRGSETNVIQAPAVRHDVADAPAMFPFLFVTIACGAVSGFHSLVSSGTTVRQLDRERDALPIGFGSMLIEGALAVLVILACVAGLGAAAWQEGGAYASWKSAGGLAAPLAAVVQGGANYLSMVGIPVNLGKALLAVTIVAFAMTTLDSATRLLRFNVEEIFRSVGVSLLANRYVASAVAIGGIAMFGLLPAGKTLWVLFGTSNQLLAGLTLLTVSLFLYKLGRPVIYTLLPMVLMLSMTLWAMVIVLYNKLLETGGDPYERVLLVSVSIGVLVIAIWLIVEAILSFARGRGLELEDVPAPVVNRARDQAAAASELG